MKVCKMKRPLDLQAKPGTQRGQCGGIWQSDG